MKIMKNYENHEKSWEFMKIMQNHAKS